MAKIFLIEKKLGDAMLKKVKSKINKIKSEYLRN